MERGPRVFHPKSREGSGVVLLLMTHTPDRHDGKLFENILLTGILSEISGRGFLRNKNYRFRPKPVLHYN